MGNRGSWKERLKNKHHKRSNECRYKWIRLYIKWHFVVRECDTLLVLLQCLPCLLDSDRAANFPTLSPSPKMLGILSAKVSLRAFWHLMWLYSSCEGNPDQNLNIHGSRLWTHRVSRKSNMYQSNSNKEQAWPFFSATNVLQSYMATKEAILNRRATIHCGRSERDHAQYLKPVE